MSEAPADAPGGGVQLGRLRMLAGDTLVYGLAGAVNKSFALILFPLLARTLTVEGYGRLDFALYAAMLFGLVIVWGQDSAVARLFFDDEDEARRRQVVTQALLVMASAVAVASGLLALTSTTGVWQQTFGADSAAVLLRLALFAPASAIISYCQGIQKWTFQRKTYVTVALGLPAINLVAILVTRATGELDALRVLTIMSATSVFVALVALVTIRRWLAVPQGWSQVGQLVPLAIPYGVIAIATALSPLVERSVVTGAFGQLELGLYAAAAKIASIAAMFAIAFQMGWGPLSYSIFRHDDAARTYNLVLRLYTFAICTGVLALSALAGPVTDLLAGARYRGAVPFVFPLAMAAAIQSIGWITEIGIHLSKRSHLNLIGFAAFLALSLGGTLLLSRTFGMIGVPLGPLLGQLALMLISARVAQRAHPMDWSYGFPAAIVAVTLATGGAAYGLPRLVHSVSALAVYATGLAVVVSAFLVFGLDSDARRRVGSLVLRNRVSRGDA